MTDLTYARKYRPSTLDEYIGNEKLKQSVASAIVAESRPQTMLLYGDSGCGKTTMARIIAKEYNCESRTEHGACGVCPSCQAMDEYISTGSTELLGTVKEIDIGEKSGKADIDAVLEDVNLPAYGDEWKVYIFDEVQNASQALQTRLLKVTEEPPEHVLFMFCTTNPEKILETLKNRCQLRLHVTKPTGKELSGLLKKVCDLESLDYDDKGLNLIISRSECTIRMALQNLWEVCMAKGSAKYDDVRSMLEEVSSKSMIQFYKCLNTKDIFSYVTLISEIKGQMSLVTFLNELRAFTVRGVYIANGLTPEGVADTEYKIYRDLFSAMSVVEVGSVLRRLLNMDTNNLELDFLMLGYCGFDVTKPEKSADIPTLENELIGENKHMHRVLEERDKMAYTKGVENAGSLHEELGIDSLLEMGGAIVK